MKVILASASKRRYELMKLIKIPFEVIVSDEDEVYDKNKTLYEQCLDISYHKALNVYNKTSGNRIIIGSDTIVKFNNKILGKPKNKEEAKIMLKELSGQKHEVITSISMLIWKDGKYYEEKAYDVTVVYFDNIDDFEIDKWILENDVCDMAGAYGIQEEFGKFVRKIEGNYYTIVGLPINMVYQILKKYLFDK